MSGREKLLRIQLPVRPAQNNHSSAKSFPKSFFCVLVALTVAAPLLSGCSSVRRAMGFDKVKPDEFAIVTKAPLVMPPNFALRPPREGQSDLTANQPQQSASQALFSSGVSSGPLTSSVQSGGEQALLARAGATDADPVIRRIVERESANIQDEGLADKIIFWQDTAGPSGTAVNAEAEAQRLRENAAVGNPPTTGATPAIDEGRNISVDSNY